MKTKEKNTCKAWKRKKNQEKLDLMQDFQQSDEGGMANNIVDSLIKIFKDMECFNNIKFKYKIGSSNDREILK